MSLATKMKPAPPDKASCKCNLQCRSLLPQDFKRLQSEYKQLSNAEAQGDFLMSRMNVVPVGRRRKSETKNGEKVAKRQISVTYNVPSAKGNLRVCSITFRAIFGISSKKTENLQNRLRRGDLVYKDGRGKQLGSRHFKYSEDDVELIKSHVRSFPRDESHCSTRKSSKEYLSPELNINRLYDLFKKQYPDSSVEGRFYRRVLLKHFPNLSFKRPTADACQMCDEFTSKIESSVGPEKCSLTAKRALHRRNAEKALQFLSESFLESQFPSSTRTTLSIHLPQVLFTPTLKRSNELYSRMLSNYSLCLHEGSTGHRFMCMWHEGLAGMGGNEVASCLCKILTSKMMNQKKHLEIWCERQNENRTLLLLLIFLVSKGFYEVIDLKFLVSGHSNMPNCDLGVIEKQMKTCKCVVPEEIREMVKTIKVKNPFRVVDMKSEDFFDTAAESEEYLNIETTLEISKMSWIRISESQLPVIVSRKSFNETEKWNECLVFKKGKFIAFKKIKEFQKIQKVATISEAKKKDLLQMIESIESKYYEFYNNLCK